jgi:hypothetical protein
MERTASALMSSERNAELCLGTIEESVFRAVAESRKPCEYPAVFILGAPRTGSTILYQSMAAAYRLPFISNFVNTYFVAHPSVGVLLQESIIDYDALRSDSSFGKVAGLFQPSEGSAVMQHWFGGGHPSEVLSSCAIPNRKHHFVASLRAIRASCRRPLLIKNAWNCFRVNYIADVLPDACFIWIKRDLNIAAASDLLARYLVHGNPYTWNSATPRNYAELQQLPYWEQVVENQAEFSRAISSAFAKLPSEHYCTVWYEDFCRSPEDILSQLAIQCPALHGASGSLRTVVQQHPDPSKERLPEEDKRKIDAYIDKCGQRLGSLRYRQAV